MLVLYQHDLASSMAGCISSSSMQSEAVHFAILLQQQSYCTVAIYSQTLQLVQHQPSSSQISKSKSLCNQHDGQSQQSPFTQNVVITSVFKWMYPLQLSKNKLQHFSYMKGMVTSTTSICRRGDSSHSSYRLYIFHYHDFNTSVSNSYAAYIISPTHQIYSSHGSSKSRAHTSVVSYATHSSNISQIEFTSLFYISYLKRRSISVQ